MRIFLPLATEDRDDLARSAHQLSLRAGRAAWTVTAEARADRAGQDEEDLEYDALQDAVHVALDSTPAAQRALVIAADVPQRDLTAAGDELGAYGVLVGEGTRAEIASFHVTELDASAADADDTDPALLWFDLSEGPAALAFLDGAAQD